MLINLLRDESPTHVAAAFDVSGRPSGSTSTPGTRPAGRPPRRIPGQIDITKEVLNALASPCWPSPATRPTTSSRPSRPRGERGYRVLVVTGDRDALQLVSPDVTVLYPRKGVSELTRFTPDAVLEKYGLTPAQYPDFAALRAIRATICPAFPGGEKTATKWIAEFGSLQALVDKRRGAREKVGDALRENLSSVVAQPRLTELVKDVPLAQTPDTPRMQPWTATIHRLFDDLEFRVLGPAVRHVGVGRPEVDQGFDVRGGALEAGELASWLSRHGAGGGSGWRSWAPTWRSTRRDWLGIAPPTATGSLPGSPPP